MKVFIRWIDQGRERKVIFNDWLDGVWFAEQLVMQGFSVETAVRWTR